MKPQFDRNANVGLTLRVTQAASQRVTRAAAAAVAIMASQAVALADGPKGTAPVQLPFAARVRMLPEGPGNASRATCGRTETVGHDETLIVGGVVGQEGGGIWNSVYWTDTDGQIDGPNFLPDLGYGGKVNAVATITDGTSNTLLLFAGVASGDFNGDDHPVIIVEISGVWQLVLLPLPPGFTGEATGITAKDEIALITGKLYDRNGREHAVYWRSSEQQPVEHFTLNYLAALVPGGESAATGALYDADTDRVFFSGSAVDETGEPQAVQWVVENDGATYVSRLASLPHTVASAASWYGASSPYLALAGYCETDRGRTRPAYWTLDMNNPLITSVRSLPLGGWRGGRVNGIIAILIGLLAPGEVHGPYGSSAALWLAPRNGPASFFDLNLAVDNLPPGARLTEAVSILPYMEQENLYKVIAGGVGNGGGLHAAIIDLDFGQ